jgi:hypothetical protein
LPAFLFNDTSDDLLLKIEPLKPVRLLKEQLSFLFIMVILECLSNENFTVMKKRSIYCLLAVGFGLFSNAIAQDQTALSGDQASEGREKKSITLNGFARGSAYGGGEDFDYSSLFGEFCLQGKWTGGKTFLFSDIRIRGGLNLGKEYTDFQLKEAYAGYSADKLDIFLGNQIVAWGRTDGFNPTNNINPNDYFFLTADPDDQKLSNFMLRTRYRFTPAMDIDVIAIPFYVTSVYRYDLFDMGEYSQFVTFSDPTLPEKTFKNGSVAARLNFEFPVIGFSVSYFRGFDPFLGFDIKQIDWSSDRLSILNSATPYLKNTLGADFAIPAGAWIFRGEIAYNHTRGYDTVIYKPAPSLDYVAAIERSIGGITTILQYVGKYIPGFTELNEPVMGDPMDPMAISNYAGAMIRYESAKFNRKIFYQQENTNHALSLTLSRSFAYDTWYAELTGYYNLTSEEYMVRPKLTWKATDALSLSAGGSYMRGPESSIFWYSGPILNGAFLELRANF